MLPLASGKTVRTACFVFNDRTRTRLVLNEMTGRYSPVKPIPELFIFTFWLLND